MKIKICGITSLEDAQAAVQAGADMLGFNFYPPSPRCITPQACAQIVAGLRGSGVCTVGVFVNADAGEVRAILDECGLDLAQLSGDEPPEVLAALGERAFKALRPADETALQDLLRAYPARSQAPAWLVDAYHPGEYGGTGLSADWSTAAGLAQTSAALAGRRAARRERGRGSQTGAPVGRGRGFGGRIGARAKGCIEND